MMPVLKRASDLSTDMSADADKARSQLASSFLSWGFKNKRKWKTTNCYERIYQNSTICSRFSFFYLNPLRKGKSPGKIKNKNKRKLENVLKNSSEFTFSFSFLLLFYYLMSRDCWPAIWRWIASAIWPTILLTARHNPRSITFHLNVLFQENNEKWSEDRGVLLLMSRESFIFKYFLFIICGLTY